MEYAELKAFYNLEPFGSVREDYRQALAAAAIARSNGSKVEPEQLIPTYEREQDATDIFASLESLMPDGNSQHNQHRVVDEHQDARE